MKIWEANATEKVAEEKTTDWLEKLEDSLKVNEKELTRLGVDLSEEED